MLQDVESRVLSHACSRALRRSQRAALRAQLTPALCMQEYLAARGLAVPVEVETRTLEEVDEVLGLLQGPSPPRIDRLMLDNMAQPCPGVHSCRVWARLHASYSWWHHLEVLSHGMSRHAACSRLLAASRGLSSTAFFDSSALASWSCTPKLPVWEQGRCTAGTQALSAGLSAATMVPSRVQRAAC